MTLFAVSDHDYVVLETIIRARVIPYSHTNSTILQITCVYNVTIDIQFEIARHAEERLRKLVEALGMLHRPSQDPA